MRIYEIAPLSLSSTLSGVLRSFTSHLGTNNRLHYVPFCTRRNANGSPLYCSLVKFATLVFFQPQTHAHHKEVRQNHQRHMMMPSGPTAYFIIAHPQQLLAVFK